MSIGSFGVRPWNFKQWALLTNYKNVHNLSNVVAVSCSYNQEISLGHLVKVDWSTEEVVLESLRKRHTIIQFAMITEQRFYIYMHRSGYFADTVLT